MAQRPGLARAGSSVAAANKTIVLVTGGNQGIGYEIVKSLATSRSDFQVLMGTRDVSKGETAASSMGAPANVNPIQLDITDDDSIDHAYKTIDQIFGRIDILINNAGTAGADLFRNDAKPSVRDVWSHVFNVNSVSTGVFTEKMLPLLEHSRKPKLIFISSICGSIGTIVKGGKSVAADIPFYNASKSAVNMLAVHYATEYPKIKVNAVCPGYRGTGLNGADKTGDQDPALGAVKAVQLATEDDVATGTYANTEGPLPW